MGKSQNIMKEVIFVFKLKVYADGASADNQSKENRCGGIGIVLICNVDGKELYKELQQTLPGKTNNQAELTAILEGLKAVKEKHRATTEAEVISDSLNAIKTFNEWLEDWKRRGWKKSNKKTPENLDIIKEIDELRKSFANVTFRHVPSCKGDNSTPDKKYNNRADELASEAAGSRGH
jgi:ribonuclease HI